MTTAQHHSPQSKKPPLRAGNVPAQEHGIPEHWIIVADPASAHFYRRTPKGLERIHDVSPCCSHPFPAGDCKKSLFLLNLAAWLNRAAQERAFERLALVAGPETLERLLPDLQENVRSRLCAARDGEAAHLADEEREDQLTETMWL